jgi:hypothetical protein
MHLSSVLRIVVGWLVGGALFGAGLLYLLNPLAGLATLIIVVTGIMVLVMPIVHVGIAFYQTKHKTYNAPLLALYMVIALIVTIFALGLTGWFNFT